MTSRVVMYPLIIEYTIWPSLKCMVFRIWDCVSRPITVYLKKDLFTPALLFEPRVCLLSKLVHVFSSLLQALCKRIHCVVHPHRLKGFRVLDAIVSLGHAPVFLALELKVGVDAVVDHNLGVAWSVKERDSPLLLRDLDSDKRHPVVGNEASRARRASGAAYAHSLGNHIDLEAQVLEQLALHSLFLLAAASQSYLSGIKSQNRFFLKKRKEREYIFRVANLPMAWIIVF